MKKKYIAIASGMILGTAVVAGSAFVSQATVQDLVNEIPMVHTAAEAADVAVPDEMSEIPYDSESGLSYSNVADLAEAAMPAVVAITNKSVQEINSFFYRRSFQYESESAGSGIILGSNDTELLICTNNHVVEDATELSVTFIDDTSYPAQMKGTDASVDLAIVAVQLEDIPEETMSQLRIARIGDSDSLRVGEQVVAIGNALGYGQSVTTGIISAKDRTITAGSGNYSDAQEYEGLLLTDAAINMGNSGGALLNMNGEVIGINSAMASTSIAENMSYAIPISKAMPILEKLMTEEPRVKLAEEEMGYLGINGQSVSREATLLYNIPEGLYLTYVAPDSPAAQAGLEEGDIITAFEGEEVTSIQDLQYLLQYYAAGETVDLTVYSNTDGPYVEKTVSAVLGDRSEIE